MEDADGQGRVRASVACTFCRSKRSKCDGIPGVKPCSRCVRKRIECELSSGKRNRGHYKPQVQALQERVEELERTLAAVRNRQFYSVSESRLAAQDHQTPTLDYSAGQILGTTFASPETPQRSVWNHAHKATSYLDPIQPEFLSNGHEYDNVEVDRDMTYQLSRTSPIGLTSPLNCIVAFGMSTSVADYLLGLYFYRYQIMLTFVSQADFMAQKAQGSGPMLRESLIFAMLAMGLRYNTRAEIREAYLLPNGENVLANMAKRSLESELRKSDITTVKALLILAEVETGAGKDMTGHLYFNLAARLIFDLRLDLASASPTVPLSDEEVACRHWMVWAASVGDQYWAVSLRKPLAIKSHILQFSRLAVRFSRTGNIEHEPSSPITYEAQINENLLDLLELSREITDSLYEVKLPSTSMQMSLLASSMYERLEKWFAGLPEKMKKGPVSGEEESYHFIFVMHLLYNANKIVIYRDIVSSPDHREFSDLSSTIAPARMIIIAAATRIAKLCEIFKHREDVRTLQTTGAQWASLAAYVLIEHASSLPVEEIVEAIAHLQSLTRTLKVFSKSFKPAVEAYDDACRSLELFTCQLNGDEFPLTVEDLTSPSLNLESETYQAFDPRHIPDQLTGLPLHSSTSLAADWHSLKNKPLEPTLIERQATHTAPSVVPESLTETWSWEYIVPR
jgi:hypothetical protein